MRIALALATAASLVVVSARGDAQSVVHGFAARTFRGESGTRMPYRLFVPPAAVRTRALPLIVFLHGSGGSGTDNLQQTSAANRSGTAVWTTSKMQAEHPAFVVAPQLPAGDRWGTPGADVTPYAGLVIELLASLSREFSIDPDRVYVMGLSLGGFGVWDLITKRPELFAAAVPVCGGGEPGRASAARDVAVWAFHGAKDQNVPVSASREMVAAFRAAGNGVKYTEYPDRAHDVWTLAFAERDLPTWLFSQKRFHR